MYVLRSDVTLTDSSNELCLIGLCDPAIEAEPLFGTVQQDTIAVNLSNRYLVIAEADKAIALWSERVNHQSFQPEDSDQWRYLDILSGLPWLTIETSEEFIPQMLNLDKLGGISFKKGCYTGQEIIARTHYLGKAKRAMFLAECNTLTAPKPNSTIIDDSTGTEQSIGNILLAQRSRVSQENKETIFKMLVVLQIADAENYNLKLKNRNQDKVILLT
jgi:folate-binding protein YgfZ